jgi:mono/diheme cytochrome c family protein
MRLSAFLICLQFAYFGFGPARLAAAETSQTEFFESKIRPLLAGNCYACHTDSKSGGLRLDSRESILQGGNSGPAISPGDPQASLLIQAVSHRHERLRMPPPGKLEPHEIDYLIEWVQGGAVWPVSKQEFFAKRIQPLIEQNCLACHGNDPQGGLGLDSQEAFLKGGASGPAFVAGKPDESLLIRSIRYEHEKIKMPPAGRLPQEAIADFTKWVTGGAVWSEDIPPAEHYEISEEHLSFWSFQPVRRPPVPQVPDQRWGRNPIDRFIAATLAAKGLSAGTPADKRTLIRRVTYDLTGLPPTLDGIEAFLAAKSPQAFEKVVERLLASRQYGERWGRHWLDLVRYADTAGDSGDFPIPEAYKYRNYVIDSFNKDKPYDQFVREQIAGDLLPYDSDDQRWEQTIGTGYIATSRRIGVSPHNLRHITIEDTINNVGKTFLGLTVGCARCHNHKFDPIPTADYYALYGIFDSSVYPFPGAEHKPHRADFVYRVGSEKAQELLKPYREVLDRWNEKERKKFFDYQELQNRKIDDPTRTRKVIWEELLALREERRPYAAAFPPLETAYAIQEGQPGDVRVQRAGDPEALGPIAPRGFLQILGGATLAPENSGSGRRELADWIADPVNPLTARVMVNRVWHYHFGRGIVATTSDFGTRGSPPTHPELLDYLAAYFVDSGWSLKQLHRLILSSETYQLSSADVEANSAIDPLNELLWRHNRRRLDAESIRDSILSFSGELDLTPGQRHPFPHELTYFYRQHEPFTEFYESSRRTVYGMQQRIQKNPFLELFDGPDGNLPLGERKSSITSLQALFMMNSEFLHRQAEAIAERLLVRGESTAERAEWTFETILGRAVRAEEVEKTGQYLATAGEQLRASGCQGSSCEQRAWAGYLRALLSGNEFVFVE